MPLLLISKLGKDGGMVQNGALSSNPPSIAHTYGKEERREDQDFAKPALGIMYSAENSDVWPRFRGLFPADSVPSRRQMWTGAVA